MSAIVLSSGEPSRSAADYGPLLRWLVFTGVTIFAAALLWRYGLIRLMIESDRTYITLAIMALYGGASLHCLCRTIVISREAEAGRRVAARIVDASAGLAGGDLDALPQCVVSGHIRDLALKARAQGAGRID